MGYLCFVYPSKCPATTPDRRDSPDLGHWQPALANSIACCWRWCAVCKCALRTYDMRCAIYDTMPRGRRFIDFWGAAQPPALMPILIFIITTPASSGVFCRALRCRQWHGMPAPGGTAPCMRPAPFALEYIKYHSACSNAIMARTDSSAAGARSHCRRRCSARVHVCGTRSRDGSGHGCAHHLLADSACGVCKYIT